MGYIDMNYDRLDKENDLQRAQRTLAERIYCDYLREIGDGEQREYLVKPLRQQAAAEALQAAFTFFEMHENWVDRAVVERRERERERK